MRPEKARTEGSSELAQVLQQEGSRRFAPGKVFFLLALLALAIGGVLLYLRQGEQVEAPPYVTEPAVMGDLVVQVSATGNLQPTNLVEVGSEQSGIIERVAVEVNDKVTQGQELARLDLSRLKDAVARSQANLAMAEAQVAQSEATVTEAKAQLDRFKEVARLSGGKVPSQTELDAALGSLKRAEANQANAKANISQARAAVQTDLTNLQKGVIRSPINGVVLTRNVNPGQTVAAALQAPVLFTLAEDLTKMQLQVDIDEADVGQVKLGQEASFTVDAWPGRRYRGVISRVGYGSQVKEGVVSYPALIDVENQDLTLRPGMTGTASITVMTRENALLVPNAALRFTPPEASPQNEGRGGMLKAFMPRPRPGNQIPPRRTGVTEVWVLKNGQPAPVKVETGRTDGHMTEIIGGDLKAGTGVITEARNPLS